GLVAAGFADHPGRHARHGLVVRYGRENHRAGGDLRAVADFDIAEDLGAGADQHAVANLGMPVAAGLAGAAERDTMQDRDVILDDRRLADDEARGMVEENTLADARGRVDVSLENGG